MLALSAFQSGQCKSLYAASKMYNVPKNTLYRRMNGSTSREDYTPTNKKLSYIEEEVIIIIFIELMWFPERVHAAGSIHVHKRETMARAWKKTPSLHMC